MHEDDYFHKKIKEIIEQSYMSGQQSCCGNSPSYSDALRYYNDTKDEIFAIRELQIDSISLLKDFLYSEITERRDYSSSKMCYVILDKINTLFHG